MNDVQIVSHETRTKPVNRLVLSGPTAVALFARAERRAAVVGPPRVRMREIRIFQLVSMVFVPK